MLAAIQRRFNVEWLAAYSQNPETQNHRHMSALQIEINSLVAACQTALLSGTPHTISYTDKLALQNNQLPSTIDRSPINVYALWTRRDPSEDWTVMYIGQRSFRSGWARVCQHLFSTPQGTQSKLNEVRRVIASGAEIAVTAIRVEPDSMRLAVEEELISRNSLSPDHLIWNQKARAKVPAGKGRGHSAAS